MKEVTTLNFRLRLEQSHVRATNAFGGYIIVLSGESPFNVHKTFSETFLADSEGLPFYTTADAARFAEAQAGIWKQQLRNNPALAITGIQEWADLWDHFAIVVDPSRKGIPQLAV